MNFSNFTQHHLAPPLVGLLLILQGCGGEPSADTFAYFDPPFPSAASLHGQCTDRVEKQFIRAYLDEVYLWPEKVQRRDASTYTNAAKYFSAILAPPPTDRFSFSVSAQSAQDQEASQALDVGIYWANAGSTDAPIWRVARVEPSSPAANYGLRRGDTLVGKVSTNLYANSKQSAFYYNFDYIRAGQTTSAKLVPKTINEDPVGPDQVLTTGQGIKVGYVPFETHFGDAQDQLIKALQTLKNQNIDELVLDLRYNSGGYLYIANSLASMLTSESVRKHSPIFIRLQANAKLSAQRPDDVLNIANVVQYAPENAKFKPGNALPEIPLKRVYVLSTAATCSASESLVNGLRGVGVPVHIMGSTTCGKPYAMARKDNCGTAYYPIQFRGLNAQGKSDFAGGFSPNCEVRDDLDHERGDPKEALLSAALTHIQTGQCPAAPPTASGRFSMAQQMSPHTETPVQTLPQRQRLGLALIAPPH